VGQTVRMLLYVWAALALIGVLAAPLVLPQSIRGWALLLITASAVMVSWNGVYIGPFQPADLLLAATFVLLVATGNAQTARLPTWLWIGAALLAFSGVLSEVFPASAQYVSSRYLGYAYYYGLTNTAHAAGGNLTSLAKFEVSLVFLPLTICMLNLSRAQIRRLAEWWLLGVLISCVVAITDFANITSVRVSLLGQAATGFGTRETGLTSQPNVLGLAAVLVLPIALGLLRSRRQTAGIVAVGLTCAGIALSGSRGAIVIAVILLGLAFLTVPSLRKLSPVLVVALAVLGLIYQSSIGKWVSDHVTERSGATASDADRAGLRHQAWSDFLHSPIHGIGYQFLASGHEVHLEILASTGLIGAIGYVIYALGVSKTAPAALRADALYGRLLMLSLVVILGLQFVENQVSDRYLFVPVALLLALATSQTPDTDDVGELDTTAARPIRARSTPSLAQTSRSA
jgi:hypothetical protein